MGNLFVYWGVTVVYLAHLRGHKLMFILRKIGRHLYNERHDHVDIEQFSKPSPY